MQTIWQSPTDYVTGDSSLQISYPSVNHPNTIVTCKASPGDLKWVSMGLRLPPQVSIEAVTIGYQISNPDPLTPPTSFISQVRLVEMDTPDLAIVRHDDPTDLKNTEPTSYTSNVGGFVPTVAVTLALRLNFLNTTDQIMLGGVGIKIAPSDLSLLADMVDVANIGIHPSNIGAANSAAALAAQQTLPPGTSQRWFFGGGTYRFDDTFHIIRPIWLEGIGGSFQAPRTIFEFPPGKHGLYFHFPGTFSLTDLTTNAQGGAASNIRLRGGGSQGTPVAHGVVLKALCFLSHLLIENFRGDGIHILAGGSTANANHFRIDSVSASNNGNSIDVKMANGAPMLTRRDRILTVTTNADHKFQTKDLFWLESTTADPNFPRGICSVTKVIDPITFECMHSNPLLSGNATAVAGSYRVVVGNGIFTHGDNANSGTVRGGLFQNNAGWAVLEDSAGGNTYWGCAAEVNGIGPYCARNTSGFNTSFVSCYSELGQKPSEIGRPAVVIAGYHAAGLIGNGAVFGREGRFLDNTSALIAAPGPGTPMTEMGNVRLGSSQDASSSIVPPVHLEFTHRNKNDNTDTTLHVDYSLLYSYDDTSFFASTVALLPTYRWQRVYTLGHSTVSAAFLLTTPNTISRNGRPVPPGKIVFPSGWFTLNGRRWTDAEAEPTDQNTGSDDKTWEVGDRVYHTNPSAGGFEGWVCTQSGTFGTYTEALNATASGNNTVTLSGTSSVLRRGHWLKINGVSARVDNISGTTLTMSQPIPAGTNLPISFAAPLFKEFGSIAP